MAYQPKPGASRPRNPQTHAQIRRDTWLQIVAPLALAAVMLIVLLVLIILPGGAGVRRPLADVSLILLILPTALVGLIVLALLLGLNYGLFLGLTRLPPYFKIGQDYVALAAGRIQGVIKKASGAVIATRGLIAAIQRAASDAGTLLPFQRRD
jgi:hypothetical protein